MRVNCKDGKQTVLVEESEWLSALGPFRDGVSSVNSKFTEKPAYHMGGGGSETSQGIIWSFDGTKAELEEEINPFGWSTVDTKPADKKVHEKVDAQEGEEKKVRRIDQLDTREIIELTRITGVRSDLKVSEILERLKRVENMVEAVYTYVQEIQEGS